jgi:predicted nucleic acid-binding protein
VRIVLDTNVVLSALLWRGTPYHWLATIGQRSSIQLYSSTALLEELADADLIVSGDRKHLLPLGSHQGIDIVDAAEAVRRIAAGA